MVGEFPVRNGFSPVSPGQCWCREAETQIETITRVEESEDRVQSNHSSWKLRAEILESSLGQGAQPLLVNSAKLRLSQKK